MRAERKCRWRRQKWMSVGACVKADWEKPCQLATTLAPYSALFLAYPQPPTANSRPDVFLAPSRDVRLLAQPPMTLLHRPRPIRRTSPTLEASTGSPLGLDAEESLQGLSLVRQWLAMLCIPSARPSASPMHPPWCVAMEASSTRVLC
jgi:hypothetical protein